MYAAHNRQITHGDTHTKIDSASKITLNFLLAVLLSFVKLAVLYKEKKAKLCGHSMSHLEQSAEKLILKPPRTLRSSGMFLLSCFRHTGPKTRVWCGSRSLRDVKTKSWKIVLVLSLQVIDWSLTSRGFVRDDCW